MNKRQIRNLTLVFVAVAATSVGVWAFNWIRGGHHYHVEGAAFNADGTLLATAGGDANTAEVILWDVAKRRKITRQTLNVGRPRWIRFSEKPRQVLLSCDVVGKSWDDFRPNEIVVLDLDRKAKVESFLEPDLSGGTLALEQGRTLVVYSRQSITLRGIAGDINKVFMSDPQAGLRDVGVSDNEAYLAAACNGIARVWDLNAQKELPALNAEGIELGKIAIADGGNFVVASRDELSSNAESFPVLVWDRSQGASPVKELESEQPVTHLRYLPGATPRLLVVSGKDHLACKIEMYDTAGQLLLEFYSGKAAVEAIDISSDGNQLVWVDSRGNAELWELSGPQPVRRWKEILGELRFIRFSPDASLLVGHPWGPDISLFNATTGKRMARLAGYQPSYFGLQLLYLLPVIMLLLVIDWFSKQRTKRRQSVMHAVSKQLGWQLTSGTLPEGIPEFHFFAKRAGGRFEHVLLGSGTNYDTLVAVYRWMQGTGDASTVRHLSACQKRPAGSVYPS